MTEIKVFDCSDFDTIKNEWEALQSGEDMTVFQHYIWYYGLNEQYKKGCFRKSEAAKYYVAYKDGKARMIAPLHIRKSGLEYKGIGTAAGVYFIGRWSFTDYLSFIYDDFDDECAQAIIDELKKNHPGLAVYFNFIKEGSRFDRFLETKYPESKKESSACMHALPHPDFDSYHKNLSKHTRQNIRTAFNREAKAGISTRIEVFNTVSQKDAEEFYKIYVTRSEEKNSVDIKKDGLKASVFKYANKKYNENLKENLGRFNYLTNSMTTNPASCLIGIFDGDKKIGFIYGLKEKSGIFRNIIVCFNEEYKFYDPGITAFFRFFRDVVYNPDNEPFEIDMTRGKEDYKYKLGGTEHYLNNYQL